MSKTLSFAQLGGMIEQFPEELEKSVWKKENAEEIVGIIGDTGIIDSHIFKTEFQSADVEEFEQILNAAKFKQYQLDSERLMALLTAQLNKWCRIHPRQCPYEPFLWALKGQGPYIGSAGNKSIPNPYLLEAVGTALLYVWKENEPSYLEVLQNVILEWEWSQPVHLMLYVYQHLDQVNDDKIDECIRSKWLYNDLFAASAFQCLCSKKKTEANIKELMRFASQDHQLDPFGSSVKVTKRMRNALSDYLRDTKEADFEMAKTFYCDALQNCSKHARAYFEILFHDQTPETEVSAFLSSWQNADTEDAKIELRSELRRLMDKEEYPDLLIKEAPDFGSQDVLVEIISQTEARLIDQNKNSKAQFWLYDMVQCANACPVYAQFIEDNYVRFGQSLTDERSFMFACAYCLRGHPEILGKLFTAIYLNGVCRTKGDLFLKTWRPFSQQYKQECARIVSECMESDDKAVALVTNCARIFRQANAYQFPRAFDSVCAKLADAVAEHAAESARYAALLLDLYERIVNVRTRDNYLTQMMNIYNGADTPLLHNEKARVSKLIHTVYGFSL